MNRRTAVTLLALAAVFAAGQARAQQLMPRQGALQIGEPAPSFVLRDPRGEKPVSLEELRGRPVVLIFGSCT